MHFALKRLTAIALLAMGVGCTDIPEGIEPVNKFQVERYLGTWYEIARLDHSFERGLEQVSASYARREDGGLQVINRGYDPAEGSWQEAEGKAYFAGSADSGHLKVSFFGPFYASYVVFALPGRNYQQAYVTGYNRDYLWFLSRSPNVSRAQKQAFIEHARALGFAVDDLVWVKHPRTGPSSG